MWRDGFSSCPRHFVERLRVVVFTEGVACVCVSISSSCERERRKERAMTERDVSIPHAKKQGERICCEKEDK
ncbi:unnamed protein product [Pylaiella littoralis]